jgi:hypothetical protein
MGVGGSGNPFSPGYQGQTSQSMFGGGSTMGGWPGQLMQPMQSQTGNLGGMFGAMSPSTGGQQMQGTAQSALGGNQMLQPMQGQMLDTQARLPMQQQGMMQNALNGVNQPMQNMNNLGSLLRGTSYPYPTAGIGSLVPQQAQQTGSAAYTPQSGI